MNNTISRNNSDISCSIGMIIINSGILIILIFVVTNIIIFFVISIIMFSIISFLSL